MGYTHYWTPGKAKLTPTLVTEIESIISHAEAEGISIAGPSGYGTPIVTQAEVALNGSEELEQDYESFIYSPGGGWSFCKTARNPYDAVVGAILLRLLASGQLSGFNSDGGFEDVVDWGDARALYYLAFNEQPVSFE